MIYHEDASTNEKTDRDKIGAIDDTGKHDVTLSCTRLTC